MAKDNRPIEDFLLPVQGMRVHVQRSGQGPPLLLLHGLVGSAQNWQPNISELSCHATVYAIDLFNMGESERVAGIDAGLAATADRLAGLLDALGLAQTDIAGHSHGGAVAMMLAARHPDRVRRLILFAPANPFCDSAHLLIRFYQSGFGHWFAQQIPRLPRSLTNVALRRMYGDPSRLTGDVLDGYINGLKVPGTIDHILGILHGWFDDMEALHSVLANLADQPTMLIWGDRDRAVELVSGQSLHKVLRQSRLLVIAGAGHMPFAESPEECNRAMRDWLSQPKSEIRQKPIGPQAA